MRLEQPIPETTTNFSFGMPRSGKTCWTAARIAESPQPGHQRTSWSVTKCFFGRTISPISVGLRQRADPVEDLALGEGLSLHLRQRHDVDQVLPAEHERELPHVHLGDEHLVEAGEDLLHVLGHRGEVADVELADLAS